MLDTGCVLKRRQAGTGEVGALMTTVPHSGVRGSSKFTGENFRRDSGGASGKFGFPQNLRNIRQNGLPGVLPGSAAGFPTWIPCGSLAIPGDPSPHRREAFWVLRFSAEHEEWRTAVGDRVFHQVGAARAPPMKRQRMMERMPPRNRPWRWTMRQRNEVGIRI